MPSFSIFQQKFDMHITKLKCSYYFPLLQSFVLHSWAEIHIILEKMKGGVSGAFVQKSVMAAECHLTCTRANKHPLSTKENKKNHKIYEFKRR